MAEIEFEILPPAFLIINEFQANLREYLCKANAISHCTEVSQKGYLMCGLLMNEFTRFHGCSVCINDAIKIKSVCEAGGF